ncbi:hypothetical protein MTO96_012783 [Rhipicephalus appendiculatus]
MGQYLSRSVGGSSGMPTQSTALASGMHARMLTVSELDPRALTTDISRTATQMKEPVISDRSTEADAKIDPRSPTPAFRPTPTSLRATIERKKEPESEMALCHESLLTCSCESLA